MASDLTPAPFACHRSRVTAAMNLYEHQQSTRRPVVLVMFVAALAMLAGGIAYGLPLAWHGIMGVSTAMMGLMLWQGRLSGSRLTRTHLDLWNGTWRQRIALDSVDHVRINNWSHDTSLTLVMKDGGKGVVPSICYGSAEEIAAAFNSIGLRTT